MAFVKEPTNEYDPNAVAVQTLDGGALGYIPREETKRFLQDLCFGQVLSVGQAEEGQGMFGFRVSAGLGHGGVRPSFGRMRGNNARVEIDSVQLTSCKLYQQAKVTQQRHGLLCIAGVGAAQHASGAGAGLSQHAHALLQHRLNAVWRCLGVGQGKDAGEGQEQVGERQQKRAAQL